MLTLVTQSDGSARRFPIVTLALVAAMAFMLSEQWNSMQSVRADAIGLQHAAEEHFRKNPFVQVDADFQAEIGREVVAAVRAEFDKSRERLGLPDVPERLQQRSQKRFDAMLERARERFREVPAQRFGMAAGSPPLNIGAHAFVHGSLAAFALGIGVLLLIGIVLEDVWGAVVFAGFVAAATAATGFVSGALHSGVWYGTCGLAGALLGAGALRQFSNGSPRFLGAIPLPGHLLVLAWLGAELGLRLALGPNAMELHSVTAHAAAVGIGVALAFAIRTAGLEETLASRWDDGEAVNPVYDKAMELREKGKLDEAFRLLQQEFARKPRDTDLAAGLWDIAVQKGSPEDGVPMVLMMLENHLRKGAGAAAAQQWIQLTDQVPASQLRVPGALAVRAADALFDDGQPDRALEALATALDSVEPISAQLATKVATTVHKHDVALAKRAAALAFADPSLRAGERAELVELFGEELEPEPVSSVEPAAAPLPERPSEPPALSAPPEHEASDEEADALVAELDHGMVDLGDVEETPAPALDEPGEGPAADVVWTLDPEALDPGALDASALGGDDLAGDELGGIDVDVERAAAAAEAFDPSALDAGELAAEATAGGFEENGIAPPDGLEPLGEGEELGSADDDGAIWPASEPVGPETALDLDPSEPGDLAGESAAGFDPPSLTAAPATTEASFLPVDAPTTPLLVDSGAPRTIAQVTAIPVSLGDDALVIETEDGRTLQMEWSRVDAVAVAAVADLSARPVLLVDLLLNWSAGSGQPLRVLRLRSDRFDPRPLTGTNEPIPALKALIGKIVAASAAVPLPDANAVAGQPFATFDTLARYEREILLGVRD